MRILLVIPHFFNALGDRRYGSTGRSGSQRLTALQRCLAALAMFREQATHVLNIAQRVAVPVVPDEPITLDVIIGTTGSMHLLNSLDSPLPFRNVRLDVEPTHLGFACHRLLAEQAGEYDLYGYLEDDLAIHDSSFFTRVQWFADTFGDDCVLQPSRYELAPAIQQKAYIDGDLRPELTMAYQQIEQETELTANVMGRTIRFRRPLNPHAGCFFLNRRQLTRWMKQPTFGVPTSEFIGPLESAATLGVMRTFRVYKPVTHRFHELQHFGADFLNLVGRSLPIRPAPRRSSVRLALDSLENRTVPAAIGAFDSASGTLTITGDSTNDIIFLSTSNTGRIVATENGATILGINPNLTATQVKKIVVRGEGGNDTISLFNYRTPVEVELRGGSGNDRLTGSNFRDVLVGGEGNDTLEGGLGNDILEGDGDLPFFFPAPGEDILLGGDGNDSLVGGGLNDSLEGGSGNDTMIGNLGFDTVLGGVGDDSIIGGEQPDSIEGGQGNDIITADDGASVSGNEGDDHITFTDGVIGGNFAFGNDGNDTLIASTRGDTLVGGDGNDSLVGGTGDDLLEGEKDNDTLLGSDGNDSLLGGDGNDSMLGGTGNDILEAGDGNDQLEGDVGDDLLTATSGENRLDGGPDTIGFFEGDNDTLIGGSNADILEGGAGNDSLLGNAGDDVLIGSAGNDTLEGGTGNDLYQFDGDHGDDTIAEASEPANVARDTVDFFGLGSSAGLIADLTAFAITHTTGRVEGTLTNIEDVVGTLGDDTIRGDAEFARYDGRDGNDVIESLATSGRHTLIGGAGNDELIGTDSLIAQDILDGGEGNDVLRHRNGNNTLRGGTGDDQYIFSNNSRSPRIEELANGGTDTLDFRSITTADQVKIDLTELVPVFAKTSSPLVVAAWRNGGTLVGEVVVTDQAFANEFERILGPDIGSEITGSVNVTEIIGGAGNDTIHASNHSDDLTVPPLYNASTGDDTIDFSRVQRGVKVDLGQAFAFTPAIIAVQQFEHVVGTLFDDEILGDNGHNRLEGRSGNDTLDGGVGNDTIMGQAGDDTYIFTNPNNTVEEDRLDEIVNQGKDSLDFSRINFGNGLPVQLDVEIGAMSGIVATHLFRSILGLNEPNRTNTYEQVIGTVFADRIVGNDLNNTLIGGAGNDTISGGLGNDVLAGEEGNDILRGEEGEDLLAGQEGEDVLLGGPDKDDLRGGIDSDTIIGGTGDDVSDGQVDLFVELPKAGTPATIAVGDPTLFQVAVPPQTSFTFDAANDPRLDIVARDAITVTPVTLLLGTEFVDPVSGENTGVRVARSDQVLRSEIQFIAQGIHVGLGKFQATVSVGQDVVDVDPTNNAPTALAEAVAEAPPPPPDNKPKLVTINNNRNKAGNTPPESEKIPAYQKRGAVSFLGDIAFTSGQRDIFEGHADVEGVHVGLGDPVLIDVTNAGVIGNGNASEAVISANGQFVAFTSRATNLVGTPITTGTNIFVKNLASGVIQLVSINAAGTGAGNGDSFAPQLSADGRFVFFQSFATNLVNATGDTNNEIDLFVRDLQTNSTQVVSINATGTATGNSRTELDYAISPDGRFVAFRSRATDLDLGVTPSSTTHTNIYWRDRQTQLTRLVSANAAGTDGGNQSSFRPQISDDGSIVAYDSSASNIVSGSFPGTISNLYVRNVPTFTTTLVSRNTNELLTLTGGNDNSTTGSLTPDGRFLTFTSLAKNILPDELGFSSFSQAVLYDVTNDTLEAVSVTPGGTLSDSFAGNVIGTPVITADGRFVAFASGATDLQTTVADTNNFFDVFVRDRQTNTTTVVSTTPDGTQTGNSFSQNPVFSGDGQELFFSSRASNLVAGIEDLNGTIDIFVTQAHLAGDAGEPVQALVFNAPADSNNTLTLRRNGANLEVVQNNQVVAQRALAETDLVFITGGNRNDTLTIDLSNGAFTVAQGIAFVGGTGTDSITITGAAFSRSVYESTDANSGFVQLNDSTNPLRIQYDAVEGVADLTPTPIKEFAPALAGDIKARVQAASAGRMVINADGTNAFAPITLTSPATSLIVNGGDGNDTLTAASADNGFAGELLLHGQAGNDLLTATTFNKKLQLADGAGDDTLRGNSLDTIYQLTPGSADRLEDSNGNDTLNFSQANGAITLDLDVRNSAQVVDEFGNTLALVGQFENVIGSAFDDTFFVDQLAVNRTLNGGGGTNTLNASNKGKVATDNGTTIRVPTFRGVITHTNFTTRSIGTPNANDDAYVVEQDGTLTITVGEGLLANDRDPDGSSLTVALLTAPVNGILNINANGSFTYRPNTGFHGSDTFTYRATDGGLNAEATVTITVLNREDAPVANEDEAVTALATPVTIDPLANDTDNDEDDLLFRILSEPTNGTLEIDGNTGLVTYTPNADFVGEDTAIYEVTDLKGNTATSTIRFFVLSTGSNVTAQKIGTKLIVTGDVNANGLRLELGEQGSSSVRVVGLFSTVNGQNLSTSFTGIRSITVALGDGNDHVELTGSLGVRGAVIRLNGDNGDDVLLGGDDAELLLGGNGNDTLTGGNGRDTFNGGAGTDRIVEQAVTNLTLTRNTLVGLTTDSHTLIEEAHLLGNAANNRLNAAAFAGRTTLDGGAGDDVLTGGQSSDVLDGGQGIDTLLQAGNANVTLTDAQLTGLGTDTLVGIENANLTGGVGANTFDMSGWTGRATINGAAGRDTLHVVADTDMTITPTTLTRGNGDTITLVGIEQARLEGGNSANTIDASTQSRPVTLIGAGGDDSLNGGSGADSLVGGSGNDTLRGNAGNDRLDGGSGENVLDGGAGQDGIEVVGTSGNDVIIIRKLANNQVEIVLNGIAVLNSYHEGETIFVFAGDGDDEVRTEIVPDQGWWSAHYEGGAGNDTLIGASGNDTLIGGEGIDLLDGVGGMDVLR